MELGKRYPGKMVSDYIINTRFDAAKLFHKNPSMLKYYLFINGLKQS